MYHYTVYFCLPGPVLYSSDPCTTFFNHFILSLLCVGHAHCTDRRNERAAVQKIICLSQLIRRGIKVSQCEAERCACLLELFRFQKVKLCSFTWRWGGKHTQRGLGWVHAFTFFFLNSLIRAVAITYILNRADNSIIYRNRKSHLSNSFLQMTEIKINQSIFWAY